MFCAMVVSWSAMQTALVMLRVPIVLSKGVLLCLCASFALKTGILGFYPFMYLEALIARVI